MTGDAAPPPRFLVPSLLLLTTVTGVVSSLGAPLVPTIAADLDVSLSSAQWTLTATMLTAAVATPLVGRVAVAHRRRRVVLAGLAVVLLGTLLSALGAALPLPSDVGLGLLLAGRVLQGVGMALAPLVMSIARDHLPADRLGPAVALLSVGGVAGAGLGFPLTALVAQVGGLAAAFWLGAALTFITMAASWACLAREPHAARLPVPPGEVALLAVSTLSVLLGVSQSTSWGWGHPGTLGLLAFGLVTLAAWTQLALRSDAPLVDLRLAFGGPARGPHVTGLLAGTGMYFGLTLVMVLVQADSPDGWGLDQPVLVAGMMLIPYSLMSVIGSRLSLRWGRRVHPARVLPLGCGVYLLSSLLLAVAHDHVWQAAVAMALAGLGSGGTFATLPVLLVRAVPPEQTASALAFNLVLRYVGFATGSAVGVTVLTLAGGPVPDERGFVTAMLVNAAVWLLAIGAVLWSGREETHPRERPARRARSATR
ncbi:MFS transporter [Nocardioides nanhaiensis]|uniref:Major facilitator superfamily (MFS) profile domain-containing protein n=1 Tax=Nocardioides nanhaiensis TaxID=1476871 RepID=A0ABP8WCH2_9ACTN